MTRRSGPLQKLIVTIACGFHHQLQLGSAFPFPSPSLSSSSLSFVATRNNSHRSKSLSHVGVRMVPSDKKPALILGSGSFTRKLILKEMGLDFTVIKRPIDEKGIGSRDKDSPADLVVALGKAKADHLVNKILEGDCDDELPDSPSKQYIVLTADQVVTWNNQILEKPETADEAKQFVKGFAQHSPATVGSCVLTHVPGGQQVSGWDTATIHFHQSIGDINDDGLDIVDQLLQEGAPVLDCAGGLMVEHPLVQKHLDRIDGTQDSVMGLSKDLVHRLYDELDQKINQESL